jgi:alpha-methylacyl-CoA racemase
MNATQQASANNADLAGVTVLDLGGIGPAARCVRVLSDLGARWVQIAPPASAGRMSVPWHVYGAQRGMERIELDLKQASGRDLFMRLAEKSDVVVECFRPGVAGRLGIGYETVSAVNPHIVYCSATGYGQSGPYAQWAGHDLNYQAVAGALAASGLDRNGVPALPGLTLADSAGGGWLAAIRVLSALNARHATGRGQFIDASAAEGTLQLMGMLVDDYLANGVTVTHDEGLLNGGYACYGLYKTADGGSLAVAAIEPKFFKTLCECMGLAPLAARQMDTNAQPSLRAELARVFLTRARDDWMNSFEGKDVCVTPVLSIEEVARNPHWQSIGVFVDYEHPQHGRTRQLRPIGPPGAKRGPPPDNGPHSSTAALQGFGLSDDEIGALRAAGTIS